MVLSGLLLAPGCGGGSPGDWKIVFPGFRDGFWSLYAVGRQGGTPVRIGPSSEPVLGEFGSSLAVSPDGGRLIVAGDVPRLIVMEADGSARRDLGSGDPSSAVWSPDGKRIAFTGLQGGIFVIGADGKDKRRVAGIDDSGPTWSPDGKRLAFARATDDGVAVMLVDPDGGHLHLLRRLQGDIMQTHWAPDGRSLTLVRFPEGYALPDLVTLSLTGGRVLRRIPGVGPQYNAVSWSPDGRQLAFVKKNGRLVVMNADGGGRRSLGVGSDPSWAPDGRTIAYVAGERPGGSELRSIRPDGTGMRRLTHNYPNGVGSVMPAWLRGSFRPRPVSGTGSDRADRACAPHRRRPLHRPAKRAGPA